MTGRAGRNLQHDLEKQSLSKTGGHQSAWVIKTMAEKINDGAGLGWGGPRIYLMVRALDVSKSAMESALRNTYARSGLSSTSF